MLVAASPPDPTTGVRGAYLVAAAGGGGPYYNITNITEMASESRADWLFRQGKKTHHHYREDGRANRGNEDEKEVKTEIFG